MLEKAVEYYNEKGENKMASDLVYSITWGSGGIFMGDKDNFLKQQFGIKEVILNDPYTIVNWSDGTKTVIKCGHGDYYDPEKGITWAIAKRALGTSTAVRKVIQNAHVQQPKNTDNDDDVIPF